MIWTMVSFGLWVCWMIFFLGTIPWRHAVPGSIARERIARVLRATMLPGFVDNPYEVVRIIVDNGIATGSVLVFVHAVLFVIYCDTVRRFLRDDDWWSNFGKRMQRRIKDAASALHQTPATQGGAA